MFRALLQCFSIILQVGLPHIRADELDLFSQFFADQGEELLEARLRAFLSYPQQACAARLDLVDQGEIVMSASVLDLVHTDGPDRAELAMLQPPLHDVLHRLADFLPGLWKLCAVSFQESFVAQCARYSM